jgi:hypothetical protein
MRVLRPLALGLVTGLFILSGLTLEGLPAAPPAPVAPAAPVTLTPAVPGPTPTPPAPHCNTQIQAAPNLPNTAPKAAVTFYGPQRDFLCLEMVMVHNQRQDVTAGQAGPNLGYKTKACERGVGNNTMIVWSDDADAGKSACQAYDSYFAPILAESLVYFITHAPAASNPAAVS